MFWPSLPPGLVPRQPGARCDREQALLLLESERTVAAALAVRAIAEGWDTGRLGAVIDELPREREVLALLGVTQGFATVRVQEASESLTDVLKRAHELEASIDRLRPLDELIQDFALSPLARMVLMLIAAPQMWGEIAQLYAIVAANSTRAICDEHLVRQLLGPRVNPHELAYELGPTQPLRRFGLIHSTTNEPRPFTGLVPDPIVISRLRAEPLDADPAGEIEVVSAAVPIEQIQIPEAIAAAIIAAISTAPARPLRIVVRGRSGSGRRTLLSALAELANRKLAVVHLERLGDKERPSPADLRRALERCALAGWIPCIDGMTSITDDDQLRERLQHTISTFPGPLGVRLDREAHAPIEPGYLQIELPDLSETERLEIWHRELSSHQLATTADAIAPLAARWRIGPGTIHRVVAQVTSGTAEPDVSTAHIDRAVSQHLERRLGDVAERVRDLPALSDLVLPADILDSMTEFLSRMRLHRRVFEEWGMNKLAKTGRGLTALFQGPPGTGKTMVAGALARELGIELYRVDLSRVMSKWIGETERNLANVFSAAEEGQAIMLFDEADSLFAKRTEVKSSNDRFANLEVNYLLQRLDSFVGIAILTTNLGTSIDAAFKRRLAFRVTFPIPDEEQREQLWRAHLPATLPTSANLDLADLARKYPLTGGSVRNCVMRAAFLAAAENATLDQDHLLRAVRLEYRAAGKLSESGALE
jgi:hypothetical protein